MSTYKKPMSPTSPPHAVPIVSATFGLGALGLGLLVAVAYFPALSNGFVWDDRAFTNAAPIRDLTGIWRIWFSPSDIEGEGHYWPLTYTTFWLEHRLWGFWAPGYHAVNMLLHFANALLVWLVLRRLDALPVWCAYAVAALFAVHPVHAEAVAWVIGRKDLLATLFYLATVMAWLTAQAADAPKRWRWWLLALALFAASLLCKSIAITLPVALLLIGWWRHGRLTANDCWRAAPFFAVAIGIGAADLSYYEEIIDVDYTLLERALIAAHALWFYVGKLLWPTNLLPVYPHWAVDMAHAETWAYPLGAIAAAVLLWMAQRRIGRGPFAGAAFFALTLSPTLGLVPYGYMQFAFVANRYQYLADIGILSGIVGVAYVAVSRLSKTARWAALGAAAVPMVALGVLAGQYASIYRDDIVFFQRVVDGNPNARDAYFNLGSALFQAGRREEGLAAARTSLALRPESMKAQYGVGMMLYRLGRPEEALTHLQRALAINSNNHLVQYAVGLALDALGRRDEAIRHYRRALDVEPKYQAARIKLAAGLVDAGEEERAEQHLRQVLALKPNDPAASMILAALEFGRQRYQKAYDLYRAVAQIQPDNAHAWSGAGAAIYHLGKPQEALRHIDRALALTPSLAEARNNRAIIAAAAGAVDEDTARPDR